MGADFSLLQTPNFAQAALGGYQAGQALGRQRRTDQALQGVDLSRPETILPVLRADPQTGSALLSASGKMAKAQHETAGRVALSKYLIASTSGDGGSTAAPSAPAPAPASGAAPPAPALPGAPPAPTDPNQPPPVGATAPAQPAPDASSADVTVTGPNAAERARRDLITNDPQTYLAIQDHLGKADENQRKKLADAAEAQATIGAAAGKLPYDQRRAYIQSQSGYLASHNVTQAQIDGFDPTDGNLNAQTTQALGVKGVLERQDKDRQFGLEQDRFGESQRHARVEEGQGSARIGIEQTNSGIAAGHLALDRQHEGREASQAATAAAAKVAKAGPAAGPQYQYRMVNGQVQRKLIK